MSIKLSIIVPSIRPENLEKLYWSIVESTKEEFELILIGPYQPPGKLYGRVNVHWIQSWRSPNAAQQQGLLEATGEYITFATDDGVFLPGALDESFENLQWCNTHDIPTGKEIVVGKYLEGDSPNPDMTKDDYYRFKYHKAYRLPAVPPDGLIFNCGIISRDFLIELGGWDCSFEATTCAHADLGTRAKMAGADMILNPNPLFKCSHQPGKSGDHGPVHEAMKRDLKTFKNMYSKPRQIKIDINNWKSTEEKWSRRFR